MLLSVNGVQLYFEKKGKGSPMILLHGNGEDHTIFSELSEELKEYFTLYMIDSRGHGESERDAELDYVKMAGDIEAFVMALNLKKPVLYGFSDGGIVGLHLAMRSPWMLSRLIISGANTSVDGICRKDYYQMKLMYFFTRSRKIRLMLEQKEITEKELKKIVVPTLVLAGENDIIKEEHTRELAARIKSSRLHIYKGETHGSYVIHSRKLLPQIREFCR